MNPKVSIIILNWNVWADVRECLESLAKVRYDNFDVILIDNASKEKICFGQTEYANLKLIQVFNEENIGFAGGNNQGIKMALDNGADYVLLLNPDTVVASDFLENLVRVVSRNDKIGMAGPLIYFYPPGQPQKVWAAGGDVGSDGLGSLTDHGRPEKPYELRKTDYVSGTCLLARKEMIEKIGPLSEDYFLYYEDTDWCLRARQAGFYCLFVPDAKIWHKQAKSTSEFSYPYIYYHTRNLLMFSNRFCGRFRTFIASLWIYLKQAVKMAVGYKKNWARPAMKGVRDFWKGKKGKLEGYY